MSQLAYLVIREGAKWSDVFRLIPGQAVTVGRAPTNQIVLKDERCSRNHVEVFVSGGQWMLRDLDSRNGTMVGNAAGRWATGLLQAGRHHPHRPVAIGVRAYAWPRRLPIPASIVPRPLRGKTTAAAADRRRRRPTCWPTAARPRSPTAAGRRGSSSRAKRTRAGSRRSDGRRPNSAAWPSSWPRPPTSPAVAELALRRPGRRHPDRRRRRAAAAQRLSRRPPEAEPWKSSPRGARPSSRYHRLPQVLAATVMREGEAVLARNVMGDSSLGSRDSQGEIRTTSVICAPIRRGAAGPRPDPSLFHRCRAACPIPTTWSSRWPWPTRWPWPWRTSNAARNWPKTSPRSARKTCSFASGWACKAR